MVTQSTEVKPSPLVSQAWMRFHKVFWTRLISIRHFGVRIATEQRAQIVGQHLGVYVYPQRMLSQARDAFQMAAMFEPHRAPLQCASADGKAQQTPLQGNHRPTSGSPILVANTRVCRPCNFSSVNSRNLVSDCCDSAEFRVSWSDRFLRSSTPRLVRPTLR